MDRFRLMLLSDADEMHELWLPAITEGFFRFSDSPEHRFLNITAENGQWVALCKRTAFFRNAPMGQDSRIPLADRQLLEIEYADRTFSLYSERITREQMVYRNYPVACDTRLRIGSLPDCDIRYDNPYISGCQAELMRTGSKWYVRACGSGCGVYVNGLRKQEAELCTGDALCLMGLRLIAGPNFLSIAAGSCPLQVSSRIGQETASHGGYPHYYGLDNGRDGETYFNRLPRKRFALPERTITVEGPPMSMDQKNLPLLLRLGSSMVMGGSAAMAGNFMTLISGVMFPFLSSKFTDRQRQEYEKLRQSRYREYLAEKASEIKEACREEYTFLNRKYPSASDVIRLAKEKTHLWERRPADTDFLCLRLGTGTGLLSAEVQYPPRRFALETDELEEQMYALVEAPHEIPDAPVVLSMAETPVCGMMGPRRQVLEFIRQLLLQISVFHSSDEVKMLFFLSKEDLEYFRDVRYLPHVWDDHRTLRFIATEEAEAYRLGQYLQDHISRDFMEENPVLTDILKNRPYYLIFALDKKLFDSHGVMKQILGSSESRGVSVITAFEDLLKESQKILTLHSDGSGTCTTMSAGGGDDVRFAADACAEAGFAEAMDVLANLRLKTAAREQELPKMVTFLEMFGAGRLEQLNPIKRWQESNPVKSLAAPVGVGADGSLFLLDLHEKRQGPHGLVAGMTGSGKSEFLITYILSMAVTYHPDEVAFVLIDYKGGGLADAFQNPEKGIHLPHLVGTITNLDGGSIQRSLMSINSEILRRQQVFKESKTLVNEGTMDIYDYQKLYRAGKVKKPMPHLFIISDEFAELKQQQPEFMDELISAARIGRSLGIHLILATQKPSGVVNDQIRSNTKFRVCLRVQDRSDSMDMLKRPEAAELTDTGRFYLQVGYNEYFALGQSAWCGAAYEPQDTISVKRDDSVDILDTAGQVIARGKPRVKKTDSGMKQIVAVVQYLSDLAGSHGIKNKPLWKPELPARLDLETYQREHPVPDPMTVCLGATDDPENLRQEPFVLDFASCGNLLIVGDSRSGKTTLIQNLIYSLVKQLKPEQFHFYLLAYSNRNQKTLQSLPHCGAVLVEEDSNQLDDFFKLIHTLTEERKQIFDELKVSTYDQARKLRNLPLILVIIDNWAGLVSTRQGESHGYKLQSYLKNTANYGIKYVISAAYSNEISARIRQEMSEHICLHLKDRYDYSELLECKVTYVPPEKPGRGMVAVEGRPLEFQGLLLGGGEEPGQEADPLKTFAAVCRKGTAQARRMAVIREDAEFAVFGAQFTGGRLPLGYSLNPRKPIAFPLIQLSALSVYLGDPGGRTEVIRNLLHGAARDSMELWICAEDPGSIPAGSLEGISAVRQYSQDPDGCIRLKQDLLAEITRRLEFAKGFADWKARSASGGKDDVTLFYSYMGQHIKPVMILFESFAQFCACMDPTSESIMIKLFGITKRLNLYPVGLFAPEDAPQQSGKSLYRCFNPERNILLLGGQFHRQSLCDLPKGLAADKPLPFNRGLMCYRNGFYPFLMPCGKIREEAVNADLENIFD